MGQFWSPCARRGDPRLVYKWPCRPCRGRHRCKARVESSKRATKFLGHSCRANRSGGGGKIWRAGSPELRRKNRSGVWDKRDPEGLQGQRGRWRRQEGLSGSGGKGEAGEAARAAVPEQQGVERWDTVVAGTAQRHLTAPHSAVSSSMVSQRVEQGVYLSCPKRERRDDETAYPGRGDDAAQARRRHSDIANTKVKQGEAGQGKAEARLTAPRRWQCRPGSGPVLVTE